MTLPKKPQTHLLDPKRGDEMSETRNDEEEKKILELMAKTFHFEVKGKHVTCCHCGVRFMYYYVGDRLNERMIKHAARHGIGA